jgi:hypothetical protein
VKISSDNVSTTGVSGVTGAGFGVLINTFKVVLVGPVCWFN